MPEYPRSPFKKTGTSITPNVDGDTLEGIPIGDVTPSSGNFSSGGIDITPTTHTPDAAGTATLDIDSTKVHDITMPAGNITIAISNETNGDIFQVRILQDSVGSRTVSWFSTIKWAGGSAPTLTTTATKADTFVFRCTGTDTYDGFIVGQNL